MRKMFLALAIPGFWLAAVAVAQAQAPQQATEMWGPQDPRPAETEITIEPVPGPIPPFMPPGGIGKKAMGPSTNAGTRLEEKGKALSTYSFFFRHLDHLDREADRQAALGNEPAARDWRAHEQLAAGLTTQESSLLKQVAYDCNQALEKRDAEIQRVVADFRSQHPNGAFLKLPPPPELQAILQDRMQIIEQHIDQLRTLLGEARFPALDSYIRATFVPGQASRVTAPVKGGAR